MGMTGPNIEPQPSNLAKMPNFDSCANDVIGPVCNFYWFQIQKNCPGVSIPGDPVFFDLGNLRERI